MKLMEMWGYKVESRVVKWVNKEVFMRRFPFLINKELEILWPWATKDEHLILAEAEVTFRSPPNPGFWWLYPQWKHRLEKLPTSAADKDNRETQLAWPDLLVGIKWSVLKNYGLRPAIKKCLGFNLCYLQVIGKLGLEINIKKWFKKKKGSSSLT